MISLKKLGLFVSYTCFRTKASESNSGGCLGFVGLGMLYPKRDKLCNLNCLYNFTCKQTSPIVKHDIYKVFPLISLKKLGLFVSYTCFRVKASERDNS